MSSITISGGNDNHFRTTSATTQIRGKIGGFRHSTKNLTAINTIGDEFKVPDYSIKDILRAIPAECYNRRLVTSFYYVFRDILVCGAFMYFAHTFIPQVSNAFVRGLLWLSYAITLSLPYTGIWILAHECGHQAFSDYGWVNDTVGWVLHSYLMVPYFSWKSSHGKHHKGTGNILRDTVYVPRTKEEFKHERNIETISLSEITADSPISSLIYLLIQQFGGWWAHLLTNVTGQKFEGKSGFGVSHFNPSSAIFEKKEYWFIVLSDLGILVQSCVVYQWIQYFGVFNCFISWFLPYVFTNHWLVFITYLQHTDTTLPHYTDNEWSFARGAAATIDREFGFAGWFFFHDICETHVLHHYVSRIPFYNARIASEKIKEVMGEHYRHSDKSMWTSLWSSYRACQFVEGDNGVLMFRNINGFGVKPSD